MNRTLALTLTAALAAGPALARQRRVIPVDDLRNDVQAIQQNRIILGNRAFNQRGFNAFGDEPAAVERKGFDGVLTARKIARAIDDGVLFLKRQQAEDGSIGETHYAQGGATALAALAMLAAGASPLSDPQLQRALDFLLALDVDNTYVRGIRANVWEYALRKVPDHAGYKAALWTDAEWLMKALGDRQAWRYGMSSTDWDNSCTQYGVLGLWAAERAGFDPGDAFWQKMSDHFLAVQSEDGGWGYQKGHSTANMATAGLASTFLVFDMLHARTVYSRANPRAFKEGASARVLAAVERGMDWLGQQEGGMDNGYFLYGIERTGVASGRKYMGRLDWFREGARVVLGQQAADGSFPNSYTPVIGTAFSTLFLVYGGAPVALNKLEYGEGHDWNLNPRDLAQVSRHLWGAFERPVNWHAVHIDAPVGELEAPILFISGTESASFTDAQVARLRDYVQRGGTILAEPTDHAPAFQASMEALVGRLFPPAEYPGRALAPIAATDPLFRAAGHTWQALPRVRGVSDGSRHVFLLSDEYLSARWQVGETVDEAFDFAQALLFYVTDQKPLAGKFATPLPEAPAQPARERTLLVARAVVDGSVDAELGARAWAGLADFFTHRTGARIQDLGVVTLTPGGLEGVGLLHITGRGRFSLDATERAALVGFVEGGGTVLVDAWGGAAGFAEVARAELAQVFGPLEALERQDPVATGDFEGGTDLSRDIRYTLPGRRLLQTAGRPMPVRGQSLWAHHVEGRAAVFFSELDLSAALAGVGIPGGAGYRPESARRIVTNLAAWLVRET